MLAKSGGSVMMVMAGKWERIVMGDGKIVGMVQE